MVVVLVSEDLLARSRVEQAAADAAVEVHVVRPGQEARGADLVLLDLDALQGEVGPYVTGPAVGFFSHANGELARRAREAGVKPVPRGRFWRTLPDLLGAGLQSSSAG